MWPFLMVGHTFIGSIHSPIPSFHYKHQVMTNLIESEHVAISDGKWTLLQAVSIPLYPPSIISINTDSTYQKVIRQQFLMVNGHFYRRHPSPIPSFHYKNQYWSNLLKSHQVANSDGFWTLLQAVSIPLYPPSTINIDTGPIY